MGGEQEGGGGRVGEERREGEGGKRSGGDGDKGETSISYCDV